MRYLPILRLQALAIFIILLAHIGNVGALVNQPNGQTVPATTALQTLLNGSAENNNINEMIDGQRDAQVQPEKYSPLCRFSGRYVAKGGSANFAIGWYNVDDNRASSDPPKYVPVDLGANINTAAANSSIYLLFPFSAAYPPANMRDLTAMSIRNHPKYQNGYIGFVLVPNPGAGGTGTTRATQYHYTESRFNIYCSLCSSPGHWISTLIYRSNQLANTFYLGFEDLDFVNAAGSAGVNGNDLDYDDFVFRFTGVSCVGAGQPCSDDTKQGACRIGVTDCDAMGKVYCKNLIQPGANREVCDGVDNDCSGAIDDGAVCPGDQVCDRGRCVGSCGTDFPCPAGLQCNGKTCVDDACVGKSCGVTLVCRQGACVDACTDIVCPSPTFCSGGVCVDACTDPATGQPLVCRDGSGNPDPAKICRNGACVPRCECSPCVGPGQVCHATSGLCVDAACASITCKPGEQCRAGVCEDVCATAKCPAGQVCFAGKCDLPCGGRCTPEEQCQSGRCVSLCEGVVCDEGMLCEKGFCIDPCQGVTCDPGYACQLGVCQLAGVVTGCRCELGRSGSRSGWVSGAMVLLMLAVAWRRRRNPGQAPRQSTRDPSCR